PNQSGFHVSPFCAWRTNSGRGTWRRTKDRTLSRISVCDSVSERSILCLHRALARRAFFTEPTGLLRLPIADTRPPGDDDALNTSGTTWMLFDNSAPLLHFSEPLHSTKDGIAGQRLRTDQIEHGLGQPEIRRLPEI